MPETPIDALLQHSRWVRALAERLARDPGVVEDIVQETWMSALRRGPRDHRSLRGWLATLLRRHLRQRRRGEQRRTLREEGHARALAQPSTAEVVERAESERDLAQAVLELREPFRSTVLLRFFEQLAPDEIAARMAVPVPTVHSRLSRGLATLRERLERKTGPRSNRAGALAWLSAWPRSVRRALTRATPRLATPRLATLTAGLAALLVGAWLGARGSAEPRLPRERHELRSASLETSEGAAQPAAWVGVREAVPVEAAPAVLDRRGPHPQRTGRVLDPNGAAVAGVELVLVPAAPEEAAPEYHTTSADDGTFRFPAPSRPALLCAQDSSWATVLLCLVHPERDGDFAVVVAPSVSIAGHVRTPAGEPLAGATLSLHVDPPMVVSYQRALDFNRPQRRSVTSGSDGSFRFEGAPVLPQAGLLVSRSGFQPRIVPVPARATDGQEIVLSPPPPEAHTVRGLVTDARGRPVAGAEVSAYPATTRSDDDGGFELVLWPSPWRPEIVAVQRGVGAVAQSIELDERRAPRWPGSVTLRLPDRPGAVVGTVRDGNARPVAGARVWLADPTPALVVEGAALCAESLAVDPAARPWRYVESDAEGSFVLAGLLEREYRLCAADPSNLVLARRTVRPGERVELVLSEREAEPIAGRVVDARGRGLAGVAVRLERNPLPAQLTAESQAGALSLAPVLTDAQGRFEIAHGSRRGTLLRLTSDTILPVVFALDALEGQAELRLVASPRAHLRVELQGSDERADGFEARDEAGARLQLVQLREGCSHPHERAPLVAGRSLVLAVPDVVSELVFFRGTEEVGRLPIALEPGSLNLFRW